MNGYNSMYEIVMNEQVVVVTGGAQGIGLEITKAYLMKGARVVVIDLTYDKPELERYLEPYTDMLDLYLADITEEEQINGIIKNIVDKYGGITHLINNAGIYFNASLEELSNDTFMRILDVNVAGSLNMIKAIVPIMKERDYGFIINMSSVAAFHNGINTGPYNISKSAVISLTKTLAKETRGYNIIVNAICPGLVNTEMYHSAVESRAEYYCMDREEYEKNVMTACEQTRLLETSEVASVALFLGSDMASGISGVPIVVSGNGLVF